MIKLLSIILILSVVSLSSTNLNAQRYQKSCPLDSTMDLTLKILILDHYSKGDSITVSATVKDADSEVCESFLFDLKTHSVSDYENDLFKCDLNKIKNLEIIIRGEPGKPIRLNIDDLEFTTTLRAPKLEKLKMSAERNAVQFNFPKWKMYEGLVASQTLEEIYADDYIMNENWFDAFLVFKNLRVIKIQDYLSDELKEFPHLKVLDFPFMYDFFSHGIVSVADLTEMPSLANEHIGGDIYPEVTFFANSLSPDIKGHPYYEINRCLKNKLMANPFFSGTVTLTRAEVYENLPNNDKYNYPIASGEVKNGDPTGIWRFKIPTLEFLGPEWYYYNNNDTLNNLPPIEGKWTYKYPDGKTAITGNIKNGNKQGKWNFYNPDGTLSHIKNFKNGNPKGLFTDFLNPRDNYHVTEVRRYYFNSRNSVYGFIKEDKIHIWCFNNYWTCSSCPERFQGKVYILDRYGNLTKWDNGKQIGIVQKKSIKYKRHIKNKYLKNLYPDKKLSVEDVYFDFDSK